MNHAAIVPRLHRQIHFVKIRRAPARLDALARCFFIPLAVLGTMIAHGKPVQPPSPAPAVMAAPAAWVAVQPVDLSRFTEADFSDPELDVIPYLVNFHLVANAMVETGPDRGFIRLHVWRRPQDNQPYNARIMENVLSLAWFYTADRPWNPYRGDPAVRERLEAALNFIAGIQGDDGAFSEYSPKNWNLASTGFMTKFLGQTLELLNSPGAPAIDPDVLARAHATDRKAILALLTRPDFYAMGRIFTNQFGNVWPGGLSWFHLHPEDTGLRKLWDERFKQSQPDFQSPCGFFYESNGPDFGYTLGTHGSNSRAAWFYLKGTPQAAEFAAKERAWFDWLSYNLVSEPGQTWFAMNEAIETRTKMALYDRVRQEPYRRGTAFPEEVPMSAAFSASREEQAASVAAERTRLRHDWPGVAPLEPGFWSYSPYVFLYLSKPASFPTTAQRDTLHARLPYLARDYFNHSRHDPRAPASFFFIRRPAYYATFACGNTSSKMQRYGLGILWQPQTGIVLQSQSKTGDLCWGVIPDGADRPVESQSFQAEVTVGGKPADPLPNAGDLEAGDLLATYALPGDDGRKSVRFSPDAVEVDVRLAGNFSEQIPLVLTEGETLEVSDGILTVRGPLGPRLMLKFSGGDAHTTQSDQPAALPGRKLVRVMIAAHDHLAYSLHPIAPSKEAR